MRGWIDYMVSHMIKKRGGLHRVSQERHPLVSLILAPHLGIDWVGLEYLNGPYLCIRFDAHEIIPSPSFVTHKVSPLKKNGPSIQRWSPFRWI